MLLEFACSNHKSIRDEILFSAVAGSGETLENNIEETAGVRALKTSVIYGANGSGKSNFIDAISFARRLVKDSINYQVGQRILQAPHKLDGFGRKSTYKMQFVANGVRYAYGFSLQNMLVTEEYLYYFSNGRQTKIYERDGNKYTAGRGFRNKLNRCKDVLNPNRLMLSCAANFTAVDEIAAAYRFFVDDLVVYTPANQDQWIQYSLRKIDANERIKNAALTFLATLETGIKDIQVAIKKDKLGAYQFSPFPSDEFKQMIPLEKADAISAKIIYANFEMDLMTEESSGVKKLLGLFYPLLDVMENGKVLVCDGLESGLHEVLVFEMIRQFIRAQNEGIAQKFAQMIFTTHEAGLLNLNLFRKDQIWFMKIKAPNRDTDLFSLSEIRNVREEENFERGYIAGKYGAIPMLNIDFTSVVK